MKKVFLVVLLGGLLLFAVSCGGSQSSPTSRESKKESKKETSTEAPTTDEPTTDEPTTEAPTTEAPTTEAPTTTEAPAPQSSVNPSFKSACDAYERVVDKYVNFMKTYDSSNIAALSSYMQILTEYTEAAQAFANVQSSATTDADLAYFLEVQTRVNKKLLTITE